MKIKITHEDGSKSYVEARWHPGFETGMIATGGKIRRAPGLWTTADEVMKHLCLVNEYRRKYGVPERDLSDEDRTFKGIIGAEAPLEVYRRTDDGEPWRHSGNLVKAVPWSSDAG